MLTSYAWRKFILINKTGKAGHACWKLAALDVRSFRLEIVQLLNSIVTNQKYVLAHKEEGGDSVLSTGTAGAKMMRQRGVYSFQRTEKGSMCLAYWELWGGQEKNEAKKPGRDQMQYLAGCVKDLDFYSKTKIVGLLGLMSAKK